MTRRSIFRDAIEPVTQSGILVAATTGALYVVGFAFFETYHMMLGVPVGLIQFSTATYLLYGSFLAFLGVFLLFGLVRIANRVQGSPMYSRGRVVTAALHNSPLLLLDLVVLAYVVATTDGWSRFLGIPFPASPLRFALLGAGIALLPILVNRTRKGISIPERLRKRGDIERAVLMALVVVFPVGIGLAGGLLCSQEMFEDCAPSRSQVILHMKEPSHPLNNATGILIAVASGNLVLKLEPDDRPMPPILILDGDLVASVEVR